MNTPEHNKQLTRTFFEAMQRGDADAGTHAMAVA